MTVGTGGRPAAALGLVIAVAVAALLGLASPAQAHNQLIGSDPDDEATLERGPAEVGLDFLANLDPDGSELDVTGPDGESVVAGEPAYDGSSVTIPVDAPLAGEYEVSYGVLSSDGHWVDGTVTFTVTTGEPAERPSPSPAATQSPPGDAAPTSPPATSDPQPGTATGSTAGDTGVPGWVWPLAAVVLIGGAAATYLVNRRRRAG